MGISGFNATASGLSLSTQVGTNWSSTTSINDASGALESALSTLRTQSASLSSSLSVVTTRQSFTDEMINTLQIGADALTLADTNEEGANMLMLQTRQNLGISSLSMASQAAQAVLKLF
jgi:flagellin-like hook-associated protein FlgL